MDHWPNVQRERWLRNLVAMPFSANTGATPFRYGRKFAGRFSTNARIPSFDSSRA